MDGHPTKSMRKETATSGARRLSADNEHENTEPRTTENFTTPSGDGMSWKMRSAAVIHRSAVGRACRHPTLIQGVVKSGTKRIGQSHYMGLDQIPEH